MRGALYHPGGKWDMVLYRIADAEFPSDGRGHIETSITHLTMDHPTSQSIVG